jgi:hypothetical protein
VCSPPHHITSHHTPEALVVISSHLPFALVELINTKTENLFVLFIIIFIETKGEKQKSACVCHCAYTMEAENFSSLYLSSVELYYY